MMSTLWTFNKVLHKTGENIMKFSNLNVILSTPKSIDLDPPPQRNTSCTIHFGRLSFPTVIFDGTKVNGNIIIEMCRYPISTKITKPRSHTETPLSLD